MRARVTRALADAGVLLSDAKQQRLRREAFDAGRQLLPRALRSADSDVLADAAHSLGLADPVLPRLLGFGWQHASGLAALAGTPSSMRLEVARLGALFNLGTVLFDIISDRFAERARLLAQLVTPEFLDARLRGEHGAAQASDDVAIDALIVLVAEFFSRCRALEGERVDRHSFADLIGKMHGAQHSAMAARRDRSSPGRLVWRHLRRKSVLPMELMACIALLPQPHAEEQRRVAAQTSARLAGEAIWIVDDLADVREDWDAGVWSRPLWLLARGAGTAPIGASDALRRVVDTGIADAEAQRLAAKLMHLRDLGDEYGSSFQRSVQATVQAWLEALPE